MQYNKANIYFLIVFCCFQDEIHLLHDDRGPVLESVIARYVGVNFVADYDLLRLERILIYV